MKDSNLLYCVILSKALFLKQGFLIEGIGVVNDLSPRRGGQGDR